MGQIVAALGTTHGPQLMTKPPTEDMSQVDQTLEAMAELGRVLEASKPDLLLMIALDHLENFFFNCVPGFTVYVGSQIEGHFAGRSFSYKVPEDYARAVLEGGIARGFDLAYSQQAVIDHSFTVPLHYVLGDRQIPVVPLYVNVYVPPQPKPWRCYQLGQALAQIIAERPERVAIMASGGLSHYPGSARYPDPDFAFDRWLLERVARGEGEELAKLSSEQLDDAGNIETRTWIVLLGAIGANRKAEVVTYQPTWHHGHGVAYWPLEAREEVLA